MLEHVPNPDAVCRELFRILKSGGELALTAPQSAYLHNLPHHFYHFTNIGLQKLLEDAGFEVLECEARGGHFINLAVQLHYTARVLRDSATSPIKKIILIPTSLIARILFGFLFKVIAPFLDRWIPWDANSQGWCVLCRKPEASRSNR